MLPDFLWELSKMKCDDNVCKRCLNIKSSTNIIYCCFLPLLSIPTQASSLSFNDFSYYIQFYVFITCTLYIGLHPYVLSCFSCVQFCVTLWNIAWQASLSMGFSRQEYWSGLPCPPPGDLPDPRMEPTSPALQAESLPLAPPGKPVCVCVCVCVRVCARIYVCVW